MLFLGLRFHRLSVWYNSNPRTPWGKGYGCQLRGKITHIKDIHCSHQIPTKMDSFCCCCPCSPGKHSSFQLKIVILSTWLMCMWWGDCLSCSSHTHQIQILFHGGADNQGSLTFLGWVHSTMALASVWAFPLLLYYLLHFHLCFMRILLLLLQITENSLYILVSSL